ncbi:TRAP transporter substrate-binding protein [Halomonas sp. GD1P12]|uniref:TRAP transporter substrate-binding protein n=1 Tax=Halomonas sp. GD1P12 TaxID=2982691 RepID=UPI0021E3E4AC|nr:TRAP transporter substrate-binding protein [Halomonas sp. GD1P12]UYF99862.1 TRAP transporter substrate-binding protein [Halomonas sp. GD1P12]
MKRAISQGLIVTLAATASLAAHAETLRLSHFWPSASAVHKEIFEVWADSVEEASQGELDVQIFPSGTLSKPDHAYQGAVDGISDIAASLQGYTSGRFPLSEIVQLPGISSSATQGSCILQTMFDEGLIDSEYEDVKVLFLFTTGPAYLHTRSTEIQSPSDLAGLRIRRPSDVAGEMLSSLGADPIGMPAPDIYTSLQRGVMDGLSFPWEAMRVFGINELVDYHLEVPYYSGAVMAVMNRDAFEALSDEARAVIDQHSGMAWSQVAGEVYHRLDAVGRDEALEQGDTIHTVEDPLGDPAWAGPLEEGTERYLTRLEERGLDNAREVHERALSLRDECGE